MFTKRRENDLAEQWLEKAETDMAAGQKLDPRQEVEYTPEERAAYHRGRAAGLAIAAEALLR